MGRMGKRWTNESVALMESWLFEELAVAGLIPYSARVHIAQGSQTYGRAWRLAIIRDANGAHYHAPGIDDYLGWSGAEARRSCGFILQTLQAVRRLREQDMHTLRQVDNLRTVEGETASVANTDANANERNTP